MNWGLCREHFRETPKQSIHNFWKYLNNIFKFLNQEINYTTQIINEQKKKQLQQELRSSKNSKNGNELSLRK